MSCKPCCCVSYRTAALVVGVLQIIFSAFKVIVLINQIESIQNPKSRQGEIWEWSYTHPDKVFVAMFFGPLGIILQVLFASFLIHGIRKSQLYLIKAELIFLVLGFAETAIRVILNFDSNLTGFLDFSVQFLPIFEQTCYIYVVYCAYLETQDMLSPMNEFHASMYPYFDGQSGGVSDLESYSQPPPERFSYPPNYYPQSLSGQVGTPPYHPKYYPSQVGRQADTFNPQQPTSQRYGQQNLDDENPQPDPAAEGTAGAMNMLPATMMMGTGIPLACTIT
ncbi:hypothetical protein Ocin01_11216, partial [Orchesella cincta]